MSRLGSELLPPNNFQFSNLKKLLCLSAIMSKALPSKSYAAAAAPWNVQKASIPSSMSYSFFKFNSTYLSIR